MVEQQQHTPLRLHVRSPFAGEWVLGLPSGWSEDHQRTRRRVSEERNALVVVVVFTAARTERHNAHGAKSVGKICVPYRLCCRQRRRQAMSKYDGSAIVSIELLRNTRRKLPHYVRIKASRAVIQFGHVDVYPQALASGIESFLDGLAHLQEAGVRLIWERKKLASEEPIDALKGIVICGA